MKIGVFDSGVGGQSMADAIRKALPEHEIILKEDRDNLPYGNKSPEVLMGLVQPLLHDLVSQGCQVIVVACNTVTTSIIEDLRGKIQVPLIGMEPMLKTAAQLTKTGVIAICATPTTLASKRYAWLKSTYAGTLTVLEPDCSDWALMIESDAVDHEQIRERIISICERGADIIVLGCTHYHWIEKDIQAVADEYGTKVIQPEESAIAELKKVLTRLA